MSGKITLLKTVRGNKNGKRWIKKEFLIPIYGRKKTKIVHYQYRGHFTRQEIEEISNAESQSAHKKNKNLRMSVALLYEDAWKGGYFRDVGEKPHLFEYFDSGDKYRPDPSQYEAFSIFFMAAPLSGGKTSENGDCLHDCLIQLIGKKNLPETLKTPEALKTFLKLNRDDPVDISQIPLIEKELIKYKINVIGDYTYVTQYPERIECIRLCLMFGHYSIAPKTKKEEFRGTSEHERKPIVYRLNRALDMFELWDGQNKTTIDKDEYKSMNSEPWKKPHVLIPVDRNEEGKEISLEETYTTFVQDANTMKKLTNNLVNMYKTGKDTITALKLWIDLLRGKTNNVIKQRKQKDTIHFETAKHIQDEETQWLENATTGPLMYGEKYTGPAYKYDVVSMYPHLMTLSKFMIPVEMGTFHIIDTLNWSESGTIGYGIYRAKVQYKEEAKKLFRWNKRDFYTHFDLQTAHKIGLQIDLTQDGENNFLHYEKKNCKSASRLFGDFVKVLFPIKQSGCSSKKIVECALGFSYKDQKIKVSSDENGIEQREGKKIHTVIPKYGFEHESLLTVDFVNVDHFYQHAWARMKPFMISKGRQLAWTLFHDYQDDLVRVHTDGCIFKRPLEIQCGIKLGKIRYEGHAKDCIVHNCIKVTPPADRKTTKVKQWII